VYPSAGRASACHLHCKAPAPVALIMPAQGHDCAGQKDGVLLTEAGVG
jgi:hypothetical protein